MSTETEIEVRDLEYAQADASYLGLHHDTGPTLALSKSLASTERALRDEADQIRQARRSSTWAPVPTGEVIAP